MHTTTPTHALISNFGENMEFYHKIVDNLIHLNGIIC